MRAIICDRYGPPDILRIEDVERPVPADDEVLVRIQASTVNRSDTHTRAGTPFISRFFHGLRRPKRRIPGSEFAGEIDAVGAAVTEFEVGDRVFGVYPFWSVRAGAHAEFMCIPERAPLVQMPAGMSFEEAAAVPDGAILALGVSDARDWRRASGSSSTARPVRSERLPCSGRGTSAHT